MNSIRIESRQTNELLYKKLSEAKVIQSSSDLTQKKGLSAIGKEQGGTTVTLSVEAKSINDLLRNSVDTLNAKSASQFHDSMAKIHEELRLYHGGASILDEQPDSSDPARQKLAKQAANYLLSQYAKPKAYDEVSAENPFSSLGRKTLSKIAFDDSGTFTSAERAVAFGEIEHRDNEFGTQVSEQISMMSRKDESRSTLWARLIQSNARTTLLSEMSETERAFRGFGTEASERAIAAALKLETNGVSPPELPEYQNLREAKDSVLAAVTDTQGLVAWKMISVKQLAADSTRLELIEFVSASKEKNPPQEATAASKAPANPVSQAKASRWLSLYATIGAY